MTGQSKTVIKEMGVTMAEFRRGLERVLGPDALDVGKDEATIIVPGQGELHITFVERPPRKIALLSIPVIAVTLRLSGFPDEASQGAILQRFDRAFQRGGG